jgi:DNA replication protein DnaC
MEEKEVGRMNDSSRFDAERLEAANVPLRFRGLSFEAIEAQGVSLFVREQVDEVIDYASEVTVRLQQGEGLLLKGPVGAMKTSLAVAVMLEALRAEKSAWFISIPSMANAFFAAKIQSDDGWQQLAAKLRRVSLLVMDDFGAERKSDWLQAELESLIVDRYDEKRPVVVTTNLMSDDLSARYSERILDRFRSSMRVVTLAPPESLRGRLTIV